MLCPSKPIILFFYVVLNSFVVFRVACPVSIDTCWAYETLYQEVLFSSTRKMVRLTSAVMWKVSCTLLLRVPLPIYVVWLQSMWTDLNVRSQQGFILGLVMRKSLLFKAGCSAYCCVRVSDERRLFRSSCIRKSTPWSNVLVRCDVLNRWFTS